MKKAIYISFALVMFLLATAENSFACSCVVTPEPIKKQIEKSFNASDAIFSGEVIEIKESTENKYNVTVKFKVAESWKGEAKSEITIITAKDSAMCGYNFEVGKQYLVYASGIKEKLSTYNCSRTTSINGTNDDAKYLAKLKKKRTKIK